MKDLSSNTCKNVLAKSFSFLGMARLWLFYSYFVGTPMPCKFQYPTGTSLGRCLVLCAMTPRVILVISAEVYISPKDFIGVCVADAFTPEKNYKLNFLRPEFVKTIVYLGAVIKRHFNKGIHPESSFNLEENSIHHNSRHLVTVYIFLVFLYLYFCCS